MIMNCNILLLKLKPKAMLSTLHDVSALLLANQTNETVDLLKNHAEIPPPFPLHWPARFQCSSTLNRVHICWIFTINFPSYYHCNCFSITWL